jgi:hypothetical protein
MGPSDVPPELEASHLVDFTERDRTTDGENVVLHPNPGRQTRVWTAFLDAKHNSLQGRFSVRATVGPFLPLHLLVTHKLFLSN